MSRHHKTLGTVQAGEGVTLTLQHLKVESGPFLRSIFGIDNPGMITVTATGFYAFDEEGVDPQPFETVFMGTTILSPGPILMKLGGVDQQIDDPERFGTRFGREWVRRFYLDRSIETPELG